MITIHRLDNRRIKMSFMKRSEEEGQEAWKPIFKLKTAEKEDIM